jgi:hypothetical protein
MCSAEAKSGCLYEPAFLPFGVCRCPFIVLPVFRFRKSWMPWESMGRNNKFHRKGALSGFRRRQKSAYCAQNDLEFPNCTANRAALTQDIGRSLPVKMSQEIPFNF